MNKKPSSHSNHSQLNRISGQIRAVGRLIDQQASDGDILQQLEAAKQSIASLQKKLLLGCCGNITPEKLQRLLTYVK